MMDTCPCGSQQAYLKCCRPFLIGKALPASPEQLMRSRYTAYTRANIAYIQASMIEDALVGFDPQEAKAWSQRVKWLGLKVISASQDDAGLRGEVEFIVSFKQQGTVQTLHELSQFKKIEGRWYYTSGTLPLR